MQEEKIQYYEGAYADEFPVGPYFRHHFNTIPSSLRYDYSFKYKELIDHLTKSEYLEELANYEIISDKNNDGTTKIFISKQYIFELGKNLEKAAAEAPAKEPISKIFIFLYFNFFK